MTNKPPFVGEVVRLGGLISKARVERCGQRDFPVLSMTMHDGIIKQENRFKKSIASRDTSNYKVVAPEQLVVGFPIDEGVIYVQGLEQSGIMSPAYNVWDIDTDKIDPRYLELALHSPQSMGYYKSMMRGTTARRRTLTTEGLTSMRIPLPAKEMQMRIVGLFSSIQSLLKLAQGSEKLYGDLVKSRFVEMFEMTDSVKSRWAVAPLSQCVCSIDSGKSVSCKAAARNNRMPGILKLSALSSGRYIPTENKAMFEGQSVMPDKEVMRGDILVARKNTPELVGSCVFVDCDEPNLMFPDLIFRMHPVDGVDGRYLSMLLGNSPFSACVRELAHGSAKSMSNIPKSALARLEIPLPPLSLQQEFATFVEQVDKLRVKAQKQKEELQTLYDSLAQEYFAI